MKTAKIKKLVALATGAAMVAGAVAAPISSVTKDWILAEDGTPKAAVVVGANAAASDAVWAGNIAAVIASHAYKTETTPQTVTVPGDQINVNVEFGDKYVKVGIPAAGVTGGDGYTDTAQLQIDTAEAFDTDYGATKLSFLKDGDKADIRYKEDDGSWEDGDVKYTETVTGAWDIQADMPEDSDAAELRAVTSAGNLKYTVEITDLDEIDTTATHDYEFKSLKVNILGDEYEITGLHTDGAGNVDKLALSSYQQTVVAKAGDEIPYEDYTVKVISVGRSGDTGKVHLQLLSGGEVVAEDFVAEGDATDFDGILSEEIRVESVYESSITGEMYAKMKLKGITYNLDEGTDEEMEGHDGWYIKYEWDNVNKKITFTVHYEGDEDDSWLTFEKGLGVGQSMTMPGSWGLGFAFLGLENKPMKTLTFDGKKIYFMDSDGVEHEGLLYKNVPATAYVDEGTTAGTHTWYFTVYNFLDGEKAKIYIYEKDASNADGHVEVKVDIDYEADGDIDASAGYSNVSVAGGHAKATFYVNFGPFRYAVWYDITADDDGDPSNDDLAEAHVFFGDNQVGTIDEDHPYYVDGITVNADGVPTGWEVVDHDTWGTGVDVYFDTADEELDFENVAARVYYDDAGAAPTVDVDSKADNSNPENYWTEKGTEVYVESSSKIVIKVPTEVRDAMLFVGKLGEGTTTEQEKTLHEGEKFEVAGYEVTVKEIGVEYTVSTEDVTATVDVTTMTPATVGTMVYTDDKTVPAETLIVVGGYEVNAWAAKISDLKEKLTKAGDVVVEAYEDVDGKKVIVAAGYTADDTANAAKQLIDYLKSILS